jgi:acetyl-CoA carboxylase carboxyl transferase subunit beta
MGIQSNILDFFHQRKERLDELAEQRRRTHASTGRIRISSRILEVLDERSPNWLFGDITGGDPLGFPGYAEKIADLQRRSNLIDAFLCATGAIEGHPVVCAELVPEFMMGSMGAAVGEAVCRSAEYALSHRLPLITFSASGGARMQEGMFSLMQMAKTAAAVRRLAEAGGLFISVLTHPTTGGVTASFASLGDVIIAEPGALIGFAGPRVIEATIGASLPEGFQSSEFQLAHGFVDMIVPRNSMRGALAQILSLHNRTSATPSWHGGGSGAMSTGAHAGDASLPPTAAASPTPWERVGIARNQQRPHATDFIQGLFEDFVELHGDRHFADDPAMLCGIGRFEGMPVTIAAHLKGSGINESIACNFGMPNPEGYRKFIRLALQAEKFGRPVVTFIDTPGAYPGAGAEERGAGEAIARCLYELSMLKTPVIAVVTGEGGSGGALAMGLADRVLIFEHAVYSILSPEGFATILWKDASRAQEACEAMRLTADDLLGFGMADAIVPEPAGGAHNDAASAISALRPLLAATMRDLCALGADELLSRRHERYRRFGAGR